MPLSPTLDTVGALARRAGTLAAAVAVLLEPVQRAPRGALRRIGIDRRYFLRRGATSDRVLALVEAAADELGGAGFELVPAPIEALLGARAIYETIFFAEAARTHASVDRTTRDRYGPAAREVLDRGERISAEELAAARRERLRLTDQVDEAMRSIDAVLSPTTPRVAPPLRGTRELHPAGLAPDDEFTFPANLLGLPAISIPCGLLDGLPVGLQLMSRRGSDLELASMAVEVERIVGALPDPPARGVVRT